MKRFIIVIFVCALGGLGSQARPASGDDQMQLGNFSVSLAVKDIAASRAFYEKLGFKQVAGDQAQTLTMCATFSGFSRVGASCRPRRPMTLPQAPQAWC
jgi:hypothetical protein